MHSRNFFRDQIRISPYYFCYHAVFYSQNKLLSMHQHGNMTVKYPMASTLKVAIALLLARKVHQKELDFTRTYTLSDEDLVPGLPDSPLDQHFYNPNPIKLDVRLEDMFFNMLSMSDNTSADYILQLLGGPAVLNRFISHELHIEGFCCTSNMRTLLSNYYGIDCTKTAHNISKLKSVLQHAFEDWPNSVPLFKDKKESCTPRAMTQLLQRIALPEHYEIPWLSEAASTVLNVMRQCNTNKNRILKGIELSEMSRTSICAGKTGSLGAITNDVAIIHIDSDVPKTLIIAMFSCLPELTPAKRDELIAIHTRNLIKSALSQEEWLARTPRSKL